MREAIMLLASPSAGLNVVDTTDRTMPLSFFGLLNESVDWSSMGTLDIETHHLDELCVLHHHGMNDIEEAFIRWKDACATSQGIALHEPLTQVLAEYLDNSASSGISKFVPLEVAIGAIKHGVELIALQLVGGE